MHLAAFFVLCPQGFCLTFCIIRDHLVRCIQDILGRAVVLLQTDYPGIWKNMLKSKNISNISPTEFINGLVIITYHTKILIPLGQKTDKLKLCSIGILILIHHNVFKPLLIVLQHCTAFFKKLHRLYDQIIKVQCIILAKSSLVFTVNRSHFLHIVISGSFHLHIIWCKQLVLGMGNLGKKGTLFINLGVNVHLPAHIFHKRLLVICIIDCKIRVISQIINMSPKDSYAG